MELCKASDEAHWELASNMLLEVVERCNARQVLCGRTNKCRSPP